jgi:predicted metal-dependent hydrolase
MKQKTSFRLVRSKRKSVGLEIQADGALLVRAPLDLARREIEALVAKKAGWIAEKQALVLARLPAAHQYASGELFWFLGKACPLHVTGSPAPPAGGGQLYFSAGQFFLENVPARHAPALFTRWYQIQARAVIGKRAAELAARHGFHFASLRITSARTRWGSCSSRATLSFAWRLVMAPPEVIDYVIVHELCHLAHPNHSPAFWAAVAALDPACAAHRAWLHTHSSQLVI